MALDPTSRMSNQSSSNFKICLYPLLKILRFFPDIFWISSSKFSDLFEGYEGQSQVGLKGHQLEVRTPRLLGII